MEWLDKLPWATVLAGVIVLFVAVVGAVLLFRGDSGLSFSDYVKALSDLAVGVGLVAVGRGITKAGKHVAKDDTNR